MRKAAFTTLMVVFFLGAYAQTKIKDQANIYQEERMVFKQWDKNKFTPSFHWLEPNSWYPYSITWMLQGGYKNGADLRPLRAGGEQTLRLGLAMAMKKTSDSYKKEADTLRNTALAEFVNYSGTVAAADPLYILYYKKELAGLGKPGEALQNVPVSSLQFLLNNGSYSAYLIEVQSLLERFNTAKKVDLDRGQRILLYHRILLEYRKISSIWNRKVKEAGLILAYRARPGLKTGQAGGAFHTLKTDQELEKAEIERYKQRKR